MLAERLVSSLWLPAGMAEMALALRGSTAAGCSRCTEPRCRAGGCRRLRAQCPRPPHWRDSPGSRCVPWELLAARPPLWEPLSGCALCSGSKCGIELLEGEVKPQRCLHPQNKFSNLIMNASASILSSHYRWLPQAWSSAKSKTHQPGGLNSLWLEPRASSGEKGNSRVLIGAVGRLSVVTAPGCRSRVFAPHGPLLALRGALPLAPFLRRESKTHTARLGLPAAVAQQRQMTVLCFGVRINRLPAAGTRVTWPGAGPCHRVVTDAVYVRHRFPFLSCGPSGKTQLCFPGGVTALECQSSKYSHIRLNRNMLHWTEKQLLFVYF